MSRSTTKTPNLRHLRMVSLIVGGKSLRDAAAVLSVSQPSLTLALSRLEAHFGIALFHHTPPRLTPTEFGIALSERVSRAFGYLGAGLVEAAGAQGPAGTARPEARLSIENHVLRHLTAARIRALDAVAQTANLHEAADALDITPASLRRTLSELEGSLALSLFRERQSGRMLTPAALILAGKFHLALREIEMATDEINDLRGIVGGRIGIGVAPVAGTVLMPVVLGRLAASLPEARIRLTTEEDAKMAEAVADGRLDFLCATLAGGLPEGFSGEVLYSGELRILARQDHPLSTWPGEIPASELRRYPWIVPESRRGADMHFRRMFEKEGIEPPRPVGDIRPGELVCNILRKSDFLAIASRPVGMRPDEAPGLRPLRRTLPDSEQPVWLIWRSDWRPTRLQQRFRDMVLAEARAIPKGRLQMVV